MYSISSSRVDSVDILKGIIICIMTLDHVRDTFSISSTYLTSTPMILEGLAPSLFFIRFITHFCAPLFAFLAGLGAYFYFNKPNQSISHFSHYVISRGLFLILWDIFIIAPALCSY